MDVSHAAIEELLGYFVSEALGLTRGARIQNAADLPSDHREYLSNPMNKPRAWAAWHTKDGLVSACAAYDNEQALRIKAHVLLIAWRIAAREPHEGWWHCYPKRPREWIKGPGTQRN